MKRKRHPKLTKPFTHTQKEEAYARGASQYILKTFKWISFFIVLLCGIALSLKALHEPDIWWMLRTGEWILENGRVPKVDVFSYTFAGTEWVNVKWGFEVVLSLFYKMGGAELLMLLQVMATLLVLYFSYKSYLVFRKPLSFRKNDVPGVGIIVALLIALVTIAFRLNGRPEMVSHVMTAVFIFMLIRYRHQQSNWIYLVIPLMVVWANMHEAYGTGIIMLLVFTVASWAEFFYAKRASFSMKLNRPKHLTFATLLAIPVLAIHPFGLRMIWHPLEIFFQLDENKFTTELDNALTVNYWQGEAYIMVVFLFISLIALFYRYHALSKSFSWYIRPLKVFGLGYVIFVPMFFFLALTAYRNIPFFIIAVTPLVAVGLEKWYHLIITKKSMRQSKLYKRRLYVYSGISILGLIFYGLIVTNTFYRNFEDNERYGLRVEILKNPVQAAAFIKENNIYGRAYSDYLTSSYLLHALQPEFKTYIDLRDLDIFPISFFERFGQTMLNPGLLAEEDSTYQFDYVVLYRPKFAEMHRYFINSPEYHLVFADPVAAVYLKDQPRFENLIAAYSFENTGRNVFNKITEPRTSDAAAIINHLFWPLYDGAEYHEYNQDYQAALFYYEIGAYNMAKVYAQNAILSDVQKAHGYELLGHIHLSMAMQANPQQAEQWIQSAIQSYSTAQTIDPDMAGASQGLGIIYLRTGNPQNAIPHYENCLNIDPNNINCLLEIAEAYGQMSLRAGDRNNYKNQQLAYLQKADDRNPNNPFIMAHLGVAYCQMNNCREALRFLERIENFQGLDTSLSKLVRDCLSSCRQ